MLGRHSSSSSFFFMAFTPWSSSNEVHPDKTSSILTSQPYLEKTLNSSSLSSSSHWGFLIVRLLALHSSQDSFCYDIARSRSRESNKKLKARILIIVGYLKRTKRLAMAVPLVSRLATLAEYVAVPGTILVAYFTSRGSAPTKQAGRK